MTILLCHKCAGVLAYENKKDIEGLLDCCLDKEAELNEMNDQLRMGDY